MSDRVRLARRRVLSGPLLRRQRRVALVGFFAVALLCWAAGVLLFPLWGDMAFYLALLALIAIGVAALLIVVRPGAMPDATSD